MKPESTGLCALLHQRGERLTIQRQLVFEAICASNGHTSPEEVYEYVHERAAAINRTTVYRTLDFLCTVGLVTSTTAQGGHLVYEAVKQERHHHLVCRMCGSNITLPHTFIAPLVERIATVYGFVVAETTHLSLAGVCAECRAKSSSQK